MALTLWWDAVPGFLRDFIEAAIAAGITAAADAVMNLNLGTASAKQVAFVALWAFVTAIIAFARHRMVQAAIKQAFAPPNP
jgi:hypothetical protein